jgi:hypothetical protein
MQIDVDEELKALKQDSQKLKWIVTDQLLNILML